MKRLFACLLILVFCLASFACRKTPIEDTVPASELPGIPEYTGIDYVELNNNIPDFSLSQLVTDAYVRFSERDSLGRTGPGMACLGPETLPKEQRSGIDPLIRPSGWHTVRYDDLIEDRYLYNRSHVIGYLLCGDNATPENLFTGTRYLNATSMLQFESAVQHYILSTQNHVIYRCTPRYAGDDLLASGVQIEAYSVEDKGRICFNVFVFNIQPGITIDYATGDSRRSNEEIPVREQPALAIEHEQEPAEITEDREITYVLNIKSHVFHYPSCQGVQKMKDKNRRDFSGTREEAIAQGFSPCGQCHP